VPPLGPSKPLSLARLPFLVHQVLEHHKIPKSEAMAKLPQASLQSVRGHVAQ